ncbi:PilN domain-containing protein [Undibacterium sp. RTI2.1]|uniref:PilN domain-containing protein n=1 Tax=unclassified Undibacterium TaxID=2630295 RepID=UPI002AB53D92|nr:MULTISPECIES: PilN domain-containing protein [unclassified Undibacterium]MDY7539249.1 PilN domain-containing protein [Undibacterium sp. 5I1]MEB0031463.1 PilN domain-containing protein [Undibacterium sp. RTI2.1]MEB0116209.1 PilN domain-containing protein [Undibacterium sp. RTI2.2]MEB0231733.1 PilN domain-containing protein [Undibacterium sp. 10I3]MEB0256951.1 PilN domain-containing protein [Undibacterium sp. 5I1]
MIKINLLPHREAKRKQLKHDFYTLLLLAGIVAALIVMSVGAFFSMRISQQTDKNNFIKTENGKLDEKIKEVASLKQEIDGLKARQQAVEDLQSDRNQPVFMFDELVKLTPEGVYLKALKQEGQRILLNGYAQSNQRVSEFLRSLGNNSPWMDKPDLIEIKSAALGQGRDAKRVFDFTITVGIKRAREIDSVAASGAEVSNPDTKKPR